MVPGRSIRTPEVSVVVRGQFWVRHLLDIGAVVNPRGGDMPLEVAIRGDHKDVV